MVELDDLVRFVQHPVRAFLRQRLGVSLSADEDEPDDGLPVELDGLSKWAIGQRLVEHLLAGHGRDDCIAAERARGSLPPGRLGDAVLDEVVPLVEEIVAVANSVVAAGAEVTSVEVDVDLGDGCSLVGTVTDVVGDVVRVVTYSRVGPKHRLAAWVRLLALSAAHPDRRFSAATVGRGRRGVGVATIAPLDSERGDRTPRACSSTSTPGGCASRCRCTATPRPPTPRHPLAGAASGPATSGRRRTAASTTRTATPPTCSSSGTRSPSTSSSMRPRRTTRPVPAGETTCPARFGRYALRLWEALLALEQRSGL